MFGFVAYQLWGTGIEYARAQDRAEDQFNDLSERLSTTTSTTTSTDVDTDDLDHDTPTRASRPWPAPSRRRPRLSTTSTTTTSTTPPATSIPDFGDVIARMDITEGHRARLHRISRSSTRGCIIFPGVGREDLKNGPGHFPETPMPGQLGNSAIAGHRTTYGAAVPRPRPARGRRRDRRHDALRRRASPTVVTSIEIVDPSDREVIATTDPDVASLTLITCHPAYSASQRLGHPCRARPRGVAAAGAAGDQLRARHADPDGGRTRLARMPRSQRRPPTTTLAPTTTVGAARHHHRGQTTGPSTSAVATTTLAPTTTVVAPSTTDRPALRQ